MTLVAQGLIRVPTVVGTSRLRVNIVFIRQSLVHSLVNNKL